MRSLPVLATLSLAALLAGCGTTGPKRAVDPRTEALRFFPADAQFVALLRTDLSSGDQAALQRAASAIPLWQSLQTGLARQLRLAGLGLAAIQPLLKPRNSDVYGPPELVVGAPSVAGLQAQRPLFVLPSNQVGRVDRLFAGLVADGHLKRSGTFHEASLYRDPSAAFAVRDGVVLAAHDLGQIRAAITTRDGSSDGQLDDDVVDSLLADLPANPPVSAYTDLGAIVASDPAAAAVEARTPWMEALGHAAIGLRARGSAVLVDIAAQTDRQPISASQLPVGDRPAPLGLGTAGISSALPPTGQPSPLRDLLSGLTPFAGHMSYSDGELRAQLLLSR